MFICDFDLEYRIKDNLAYLFTFAFCYLSIVKESRLPVEALFILKGETFDMSSRFYLLLITKHLEAGNPNG